MNIVYLIILPMLQQYSASNKSKLQWFTEKKLTRFLKYKLIIMHI